MVMLVAIDESGDPGFGKGASEHLIVSFVFCRANIAAKARDIMMTAYRSIERRRFWPSSIKELKFILNRKKLFELGTVGKRTFKNMDTTRENVLSEISKTGTNACISHTIKKQVYNRLRANPERVYNYALAHPFINDFINYFPQENDFEILLDKRMKDTAARSLNEYISRKGEFYSLHKKITFKQVDSTKEPLIWIADFISGARYYKEIGRGEFYEKISKIILKEHKFWK